MFLAYCRFFQITPAAYALAKKLVKSFFRHLSLALSLICKVSCDGTKSVKSDLCFLLSFSKILAEICLRKGKWSFGIFWVMCRIMWLILFKLISATWRECKKWIFYTNTIVWSWRWYILDTGCKLNLRKMFRRRPGLMQVQFTSCVQGVGGSWNKLSQKLSVNAW